MGSFNDLSLSRTAEDAELDRRDGLTPEVSAQDRLRRAAPALFTALQTLVRADNVNYWRDTMRHAGMFEAGRDALELACGDRHARRSEHTRDPLIWALTDIAAGKGETVDELRRMAREALDQAGCDPVSGVAIDVPAGWDAPAFALGQTVYVRESSGLAWQVCGLRWDDYGPLSSSTPGWVYRLSRAYAMSGSHRIEHDKREHEQDDLSATPWCDACGLVAMPADATSRSCAGCLAAWEAEDAADEAQG